jgi:Ca2+-transporting ATPase
MVNRSWSRTVLGSLRMPNGALWWVLGGTAGLLAIVLAAPFAQRMFHFAPLHPSDLGLSLAAGMVCVMWFDLLKLGGRLAPALASVPTKERNP